MILDKLMEKKDLLAYCVARKKRLIANRKEILKLGNPKERELVSERFVGRIYELNEIIRIVKENKLKDASKQAWKKVLKE